VGLHLAYKLTDIPLVALTLIIAFTVHEFAHAFTAYKFGDPTAKKQGRLTLNPIHHLDPFGTLLIFFAGIGWARPVPVNRYHFKNPRVAGILVSVMGPVSNFLLAFIGFGILFYLVFSGVGVNWPNVTRFFNLFVSLNLMLFAFNLVPLPPLDGYRIIEDVVNPALRAKLTGWEQYSILVFLVLMVTPLSDYTISPYIGWVSQWATNSFNTIYSMFM
jgi:Zn-dependent protease